MYFKAQYVIQGVMVPNDIILDFELKEPYHIKIQIKNPPKEDIELYSNKAISFCDVFTSREITKEFMEVFKSINAQFTKSDTEPVNIDQILVPENYVNYLNTIRQNLMDAAINLIGLLRWTNNFLGPHNPFSSRGDYWSIDNIQWNPFPAKFTVFIIQEGHSLHIHSKGKDIILDFLNKGITEPIYHELFREAWDLRVSNPRSSIIIGVASFEVGVKTVISTLIPETKWLMESIIAPPIDKILTEYFPKLPVIKKINDKSEIPTSIIDTARKMNGIRNKQVHVGLKPPDSKKIESMLQDVQDLLLLLDYYCGFDFALSFVRPEKLREIGQICQQKTRKENKY
jgi:hypothetical protein